MLGFLASLLAGEIASKDTTPLGLEDIRPQQTQVCYIYIGAASPSLEKCKSSELY
tara:strand:+ start:66 stop:230 length:165 start_codon:yes stop_codon:yes gene_type:complete